MKNIYFFRQKMWQSKWILTLFLALFFMCGFMLTGWGQTVTIMYDNPISRPCIASTGSSAPGTYSFTAPLPSCATNISGQAYGGGGGAGGTSSLGGHGGGGGGGGYISLNFGTGTGNSITGQVGGGGARGESGSNSGRTGGQSYVTYNNITIRANGGVGGTYRGPFGGTDGSATGAGGGTSGNGNINIAGSNGGSAGSGTGGVGGTAGGPNGGIGGSVLSSTGVGNNGCNPGGGGSSGYGLSEPGGHGSGGRVLISYDIPTALVSGTGTYCIGNTVNMSICAQTPGVTYQWYKDGSPLTGITGNTYTITNVQVADAGEYWVIATYNINYPNATNVSSNVPGLSVSGTTLLGSLRSASAYVTVRPVFVAGEIVSGSSTICSGAIDPASIGSSIPASGGDNNITYQWYRNGTLISGTNSATYTIPQSDRINTGTTDITIVYTRSANDGTCQTTPVSSSGSYTLIVQPMATTALQRAQTVSVCAHDVSYSLPNWNGSPYVINGEGVWRINGEAGIDYQGTFTGNVYTLANVEEVVTFTFLIYNTAASCQKDNPVDSVILTLNVSESVYPTFNSDTDTVCSGTTEIYVLNVMDIEYEYIWNITGDAGWKVVSGGNGNGAPNNYSITILWENPGNATISVAVTDPENPECVEGDAEIIVTVKPLPNVSITGTTPICNGGITDITLTSGLAGTTFSWVQTSTNVSGATNGSAFVIEQELTLTDSTASGSVVYRVTPTLDGCDGQYEDITIIVNPEAVFDVSSITDEDIICVTQIAYELPDWEAEYVINGRGEWNITGSTAVGGSLSGRDYTINGAAGIVVFTFSVFNTETPCQTGTAVATKVFTLVIDPSSVAGNITEAKTIVCYNTGTMLTLNNYMGNIQWQSSIISGTEGFTDILDETNETLFTGDLMQNTWFRTVVTNGVCSEAFSSPVLIAVYLEFNPGEIITGNETICVGESASEITSVTAASGGDGIYSYQWYDEYGPIGGATDPTYTPGEAYTTIAGAYTFYREAMDGTCNTSGVFSTGEWILTVETATLPGTISSAQVICSGDTPAPLTLGGTIVGNVVEWQYSIDNFATFTTIANATTTLTSAEMGNLTANRYYRAMVQNGVCPPTYSDTVLITVDPTSVGGTISSAQTICSGSTPNPLELTGNTGAIVRWESSTDNFNLNIVTVSGSAGLSTLPLSSLTTNTYYRAVVQNGVCPSTYSDTVLITVQPTAEIDLPTGEPTTVFVCAHDLEYELPDWEQYIEYGTGVWTINGTSYLGTFDGVNTYTLGGEEIVTFTFSVYNTSTTCQNLTPVETIFFTLTVSESIYPEFDPDTDEVCSGDIKTYTLSNVNNKAYEYTWIITGDATFTVLSGGNQGGALDNYSIEISWEDAGEAIISVTIIDPNDLKCVNDNAEITITVNPLPTVSITGANTICVASTTQLSPTIDGTWVSSDETVATVDNTGLVTGVSAGSATFTFTDNVTDCSNTTLSVTVESTTVPGTISEAQTICTGGMPEPLTLSGNNGTVIEWQYSIDNFASFATIANVTTTLTSAEMGVLTTNTYYRAAVQSGVCPLAYSDTVLITVVPQPTLSTPIASNTSICEGGETTLSSTLSNGTGIPIYQWQYNNSGTWGNIANGTPAGAIYTAASNGTSTLNILGITVPDDHEYQLIAAMTGTGCNTVTSNPVIVSVIAIAVEGYITADEEFVCYDMGTTLTLNDYEGSIQWQSSTTSATAGFANILGETSATLATGGLTQTTWFRTVVTNPICGDVVSEAKEITMIPDPTVTLTSGAGTDAQTLRVGGTLTNITYITTDAVDVTVANLPPGINGVWLDDVLTISGIPSNEGVFNYTVTVTGVCETATATGTITVRQACPTQITDNINTITYNVVELMGYCWYKENVRGTKYQDGTNITPEPKTYVSSLFPDENQNADNFGLLYTYEAAFPLSTRAGDRTLCPDGWRIPTSAEWALLNTCNINDLRNPVYWLPGNNTNDLQFDARGAGYYSSASNRFEDLLGYTAWWSSDMPGATTGIAAVLHYYCSQFEILEITRADAISVRCILDD